MRQTVRTISTQEFFPMIESVLAEGKQTSFTVSGSSMLPFIGHNRDQVVVEACDPQTVRRGDIVLMKCPGEKYILHRVVRVQDGLLLTLGDGNLSYDPPVPLDCVRARVTMILRKGRRIDCTAGRWKLVFELWMRLFPVRGALLRGIRLISRIKSKK